MTPTAEASQYALASLFDDIISEFGLDDRDNADDYDRLDEQMLHCIHADCITLYNDYRRAKRT
jgi:hypothetical protein